MNINSKSEIDKLIPKAIETLLELNFPDKQGKISSTYHGYFSSFGADMICSTPLAAAIFAEESTKKEEGMTSGTKEDKKLIPKAILRLVSEEYFNGNKKLSDYIIDNSQRGKVSPDILDPILNATIALKMAIRTFKKS